MAISPAQCRAARGLLDWSQTELAQRMNVDRISVARFEAGTVVSANTVRAIQERLEKGGVRFISGTTLAGAGVRLAKP